MDTNTPRMKARGPVGGFTLLELVVTMALLAILLTIGVPWLGNFIQDNRMAAQVNDMKTALNLARSEALKLGTPVTLCPTESNPTDSTVSCTTAGWSEDWIVFPDEPGNIGTNTTSPTQASIIRFWQRGDRSATVTTDPNVRVFRFLPNGTFDVAAFGIDQGDMAVIDTVSACANAGEFACLIFSIQGSSACRAGRDIANREISLTRTGRASINNLPCPP